MLLDRHPESHSLSYKPRYIYAQWVGVSKGTNSTINPLIDHELGSIVLLIVQYIHSHLTNTRLGRECRCTLDAILCE